MNPAALADRYGTPIYVYDLVKVRRAHADLRAALPQPATIYYSLKANPHPLLVKELARLGCRAEVSSRGEVEAALSGGAAPDSMLLTGPGKTGETVVHALGHGVRRFSVESPADLATVGRLAGDYGVDVDCLVRVNADRPVPGMGLAMTGAASQFGADASWVVEQPELFRASGRANVKGLHLYMGTNLLEQGTLLRQFEIAAGLAARLRPILGDLVEVDLGGGFGAPYASGGHRPIWGTLRVELDKLLDRHLPGWRSGVPRIAFESGRYLVGDCGVLLTRVVDVKSSKGQLFAILDAGTNSLGGMAGLRRLPPIVPTVEQVEPAAGVSSDDGYAPTTVVGPLCTPLDTFVRGAPLPRLVPGQLVCIPNVGAYGLTASLLAFLSHPVAAEVIIDGDDVLDVSHLRLTRAAGTPKRLGGSDRSIAARLLGPTATCSPCPTQERKPDE